MNYSDRFERKFVEVVAEMVLDSEMNHSDFANAALPEVSNAVGKWRRMRNAWQASSTGRPQKLTLPEAVRFAETLGKTFSELCFTVEQRLKTDQ